MDGEWLDAETHSFCESRQKHEPGAAEAVDQSEDVEVVNAVTAAMREADQVFEKVGGSTRHHVRDCLLPVLNRMGWQVLRAADATNPLSHRDEVLLKAIKLLEALADSCDVESGRDHAWRQCRRCLAIREFEMSPIETRKLMERLLLKVRAADSPASAPPK